MVILLFSPYGVEQNPYQVTETSSQQLWLFYTRSSCVAPSALLKITTLN